MKNRVESVFVRACVLCVSVLALCGTPAAGQSISGTVANNSGVPLRGVVVTFLDGTNAEQNDGHRHTFKARRHD